MIKPWLSPMSNGKIMLSFLFKTLELFQLINLAQDNLLGPIDLNLGFGLMYHCRLLFRVEGTPNYMFSLIWGVCSLKIALKFDNQYFAIST